MTEPFSFDQTVYDWMGRFSRFAYLYYPFPQITGWPSVTWNRIGFGAYEVRLSRYLVGITDHFVLFPDGSYYLVRRELMEATPPEEEVDNGIWLEFEHWKTGTTRLADRLKAADRPRDRVGSV